MTDPFAARFDRATLQSPEDARALRALTGGRVRRYGPRADVVREGDDPRCVRVVVSGWACRYKQLPDGRRQIVALLLPGDVCDHDVSLPDELDHAIGAIGAVTLREVDPATYAGLSRADGALGRALRRAASAEVAIQREWTHNLGRRDGRERLAHLLCEVYHRLGAAGLVAGGGYDLPLTQVDLADALGMTPVHANRMLRVLREAGLIVLARRRVTVPDLAALERAALFDRAYLHLGTDPGAAAA